MNDELRFKKHIFICANQRAEGQRVCCGEAKGMELTALFKKQLKDKGLSGSMRAQRTGCFDFCENGPNIVVYPEGVFYGNVQPEDVEEIVEQHLKQNKPVERLKLRFGPDGKPA